MTVRVFTLHYGAAPYLATSREINERYCARHGLQFVVTAPVTPRPRGLDAVWSKVTRARELLDGCDALLYLDGDAVFVDHESPIEALTENLPAEKTMLIGEDLKSAVANTGVWLVRSSEQGRAILDAWAATPSQDRTLGHRWPLDEAGFNERVLPAFSQDIELIPRREIDLFGGEFIHHHCMLTISGKNDALEREAARLGL